MWQCLGCLYKASVSSQSIFRFWGSGIFRLFQFQDIFIFVMSPQFFRICHDNPCVIVGFHIQIFRQLNRLNPQCYWLYKLYIIPMFGGCISTFAGHIDVFLPATNIKNFVGCFSIPLFAWLQASIFVDEILAPFIAVHSVHLHFRCLTSHFHLWFFIEILLMLRFQCFVSYISETVLVKSAYFGWSKYCC